jgi:hypothetical protein
MSLAAAPSSASDLASVRAWWGWTPVAGIDGEGQDLLGGVVSDALDVHAALGGGDHRDAGRLTVDQQGEVQLASNVGAFLDVEAVDLLALGAGLDGDEHPAEHLLGVLADVLDGLDDADAALGVLAEALEAALAAASGVDLGLHDEHRAAQLLRRRDRLVGGEGGLAAGHVHAERAQDGLGLVLVNVHGRARGKLKGVAGVLGRGRGRGNARMTGDAAALPGSARQATGRPMELDCYQVSPDAPPLTPAAPRRDWMDKSNDRFAYRCLPLTMANSSGWEMRLPATVRISWNGKADRKGVSIAGYDSKWPVRMFVQSHFGEGVVTFITGYLFRTPPGVALWAAGPPNEVKDGIGPLTGLIETDWLPFPFTMNWKFTRPGEVTFEKGEVFCFLTLMEQGRLDAVRPRVRSLSENPELDAEYKAWTRSREQFNAALEAREPEALKEAWQRFYMRGETPTGAKALAHATRRTVAAPRR